MGTKQEVTKKFVLGIVLIVVSLVLGKAVLIPLILFPGSEVWRTSMILVYVFSWIILLAGIYLAGMEGWRLVTHKYMEYRARTVSKVREKSRNAATKVRNGSKNATIKTINAMKKPMQRRREKLLAKEK